ncbi:MAG: hypothetical protein QM473_11720, partial [Acidobacteriota bacterium]|nr:hypothetical protein [Acidobacteriota bacterium]
HIIIQRRRPGQVLVLQRDHLEPRFPEVAIIPSPFFSGYMIAITTNNSIRVKPRVFDTTKDLLIGAAW